MSSANWADKKLTSTQRADLVFRYQDWLLTKRIPSGGFRVLYVITQCFNAENPFHCFPSIEYLAAQCRRSPSTVWEMLPKLEKAGGIEIVWGSRGSRDPNTYRLPAAFLEFYFGLEKGRLPRPMKPRRAGVSEPRLKAVTEAPETPVEHPGNTGLAPTKPRRAGVNHLVATYKQQEGGEAPPVSDSESSNRAAGTAALSPDLITEFIGNLSAPSGAEPTPVLEKEPSTTSPLNAPSLLYAHRPGEAARRPNATHASHWMHPPHHQPREDNMTTMTMPQPTAAPAAYNAGHASFFAYLLDVYPRRDGRDEARATLRHLLMTADPAEAGQFRACLIDGARAYEAKMRAAGSTNFLRLDDFIRCGVWRSENLPFNLAQAA
jgi:hypothetical protein